MLRAHLTLLCGLVALAAVAFADASAVQWKIDPMLDGGDPVISAMGLDAGAEITWTHTDAATGDCLLEGSGVAQDGQAHVSTWPTVGNDTFVRTMIWIDEPADREADFVWSTLIRSGGASLRDYRGLLDFSPPDDFDEYWARAIAELDAVPMVAEVTELAWGETATGRLFEVTLDTVRDTRIVCRVTIPKMAHDHEGNVVRQFPAMIVMPGYGAEQPPMDRTPSGFITMSVNPRHHGPSKRYWTSPVEHMIYGIEEPEDYYYRLAFLDNLRAAQYLLSRPEVDPKRVAAEGGSQGGLFAVALAALEPRIAVVVSNVPAFAAMGDGLYLNQRGTTQSLRAQLEADTAEAAAMRRSLSYIDAANIIRRVHVPVQVNMGGQDPICHFLTGMIMLHNLPADTPREFNVIPEAKHEVPGPMRAANGRWVMQWMGLESEPSFPGAVLAPKEE